MHFREITSELFAHGIRRGFLLLKEVMSFFFFNEDSVQLFFFFFFFFFNFIGVQLTDHAVLVSGVQQSEYIYMCVCVYIYPFLIQFYIYIYIYLHSFFPYRLLQSIEQTSLCYTVGPCQISVLYIQQCVYVNHIPYFIPRPHGFPFGNCKFEFKICVFVSVFRGNKIYLKYKKL